MAARERRSLPRRRIAPREENPSAVGPHEGHPTGTAGEGPRGPAEDEARWWMALVASAEDAIHGTTLDGRILGWNRGAERLYGYTAEEVVGRPVAMLCPPDRLDEARQFLDRVGQGQVVRQIETLRVRKDGCVIEVELTISPVRDAAGRVIGALSITRDTSERQAGPGGLAGKRGAVPPRRREHPRSHLGLQPRRSSPLRQPLLAELPGHDAGPDAGRRL